MQEYYLLKAVNKITPFLTAFAILDIMLVADGCEVIKGNIDPIVIAEEFVIQELIKMFPKETEQFYDIIRFYVRDFKNVYSEHRLWKFLAGLSNEYMFKSVYQILRGDQYYWNLESIPLKDLRVKMLSGKIDKILRSVDFRADKAGEILQKLDPKERNELIEPFKLSEDNYPILVVQEGNELVVHDGNRRTMDAAIYGMPAIKGYVGRLKNPPGKPAISEGFIILLFHLFKDVDDLDDTLVEALCRILIDVKKTYKDAPELIDMYIPRTFEVLKNSKQREMLEKVLKEKG